MTTSTRTLFTVAMSAAILMGQPHKLSPHETVTGTAASAKLTITYGRPYLKGRALSSLVPDGEVWRVGADEATTLTTDKNITLGSLAVPAGTYALFLVPKGETGGELVVNKVAQQWGLDYDKNKGEDLGRTDVKVMSNPTPVEQFTIAIAGGKLRMMWGSKIYEVSIKAS